MAKFRSLEDEGFGPFHRPFGALSMNGAHCPPNMREAPLDPFNKAFGGSSMNKVSSHSPTYDASWDAIWHSIVGENFKGFDNQ